MIFLIIITLYYSKTEKEFSGRHINYDILDNDKLNTETTITGRNENIIWNIYNHLFFDIYFTNYLISIL